MRNKYNIEAMLRLGNKKNEIKGKQKEKKKESWGQTLEERLHKLINSG